MNRSCIPVMLFFVSIYSLHDRRICVLGLCCLMNTPHNRPEVVNQVASQIIPAALLVFKGLKRAYQSKIFSAFI